MGSTRNGTLTSVPFALDHNSNCAHDNRGRVTNDNSTLITPIIIGNKLTSRAALGSATAICATVANDSNDGVLGVAHPSARNAGATLATALCSSTAGGSDLSAVFAIIADPSDDRTGV